jgi:hypothetical protein
MDPSPEADSYRSAAPSDPLAMKRILTKPVLATIPDLAASGLNRHEIAARLGCKLSTLKVRCSQEHIRLPAGPRGRRPLAAQPRPVVTPPELVSADTMALFKSEAEATSVADIIERLTAGHRQGPAHRRNS